MAIQLNNLNQKAAEARTISEQANELIAKNSNAIAARDLAFNPLRILNAIKASNVQKRVIDNAATNNRKMQGQRVSAKLTDEEKQKLAAEGTIINQISAAQLSYDNLLDTFDKQIKVLANISLYMPNEVDLQLATLSALYNDLLQKNRDVVSSTSLLSNIRLNRDQTLYDAETGILALALDVKNYVKSIFGATAPQFKQISDIKFRTLKT